MLNSILSVSAVVFTKNEELNIIECLNSLKNFDEIVVLDSCSLDQTRELATGLGAKVVDFNWNGQYPKKRQWSLENIKYRNSWIFFVDADERVTEELTRELRDFLNSSGESFAAGSIPIDYYFAGQLLRYGQRPRKTVLLHLGKARFPKIDDLSAEGMGELEGHYQPVINGKIRKFKSRIKHKDNDPISTWMTRHVSYAKWEAFLLQNQEVKVHVDSSKGRIVSIFHKLPFRPLAFFCYSYFLKVGFLDGKAGLNYALAKSWYYWLSGVIASEKIKNVK